MSSEFEKRGRFTLVEAARVMDQQEATGETPHHMLSNDDSYSIISHAKDEICDFCIAAQQGNFICTAKLDIFEKTRQQAMRIIQRSRSRRACHAVCHTV